MTNRVRARPRRPLRYEFYSLVSVLAIPVALCFIFPREAIGFEPREERRARTSSCAFVTLSEEEVSRILSRARAAWRVNTTSVRDLRVDLSVAAMPEEPARSVMTADERLTLSDASRVSHTPDLMPASRAAGQPTRFARDEEEREMPPFSKEELLTIDDN